MLVQQDEAHQVSFDGFKLYLSEISFCQKSTIYTLSFWGLPVLWSD